MFCLLTANRCQEFVIKIITVLLFQKKEEDILRLKLEEQRRQQEQQWRSENFMRDGETGKSKLLHVYSVVKNDRENPSSI